MCVHRGLCHCFEHGQQQLELELVVDPGLLVSKSILASVSPPCQFYSVGAKKVFTSGKVGRKYYMKCVCVCGCVFASSFSIGWFYRTLPIFASLLSTASPLLMVSLYSKFLLSGLSVSTVPDTLSILQFSAPETMNLASSLSKNALVSPKVEAIESSDTFL